jgi:hypothetical protein
MADTALLERAHDAIRKLMLLSSHGPYISTAESPSNEVRVRNQRDARSHTKLTKQSARRAWPSHIIDQMQPAPG